MFCHNCGVQIEENANFCHVCGAKVMTTINESVTQVKADETTNTNTNTSVSVDFTEKMSSWAIFPAVWVVFHVVFVNGYVSINSIAEALGGALVVLMIPLIITAIISAIKSFLGQRYTNFVKHTFIGTGIMLVLGILSVFND